MDKAKKIKLGLGLAMVGILAYTTNYVMKQVRLLVNTEFKLAGTKVNTITLKKVSITLWWKVVNKSDISITVSNQVYDVYLNDQFIKKVGSAIPVEIAPHAETSIPTHVVFSPKEAIAVGVKNFGSLLTKEGRSKVNLKVVGTVNVKTSVFEVKEFPFNFEDSIQNIMDY